MTLFWGRLTVVLVLLCTVFGLYAYAEAPKLTENAGSELRNAYKDKEPYTLRLLYTDPAGDTVGKSKAVFVDEGPSGTNRITANAITGSTTTGAVVEWHVNGFEPGAHKGYFEVNGVNGVIRYPTEPTEFYSFVVENLTTKWIILGVGSLICLMAVPAVVFFLSRTINPRGDGPGAARIGFLIGVLSLCGLFIYLFLSVYGPLVFAILLLGILALPLLLTRKR